MFEHQVNNVRNNYRNAQNNDKNIEQILKHHIHNSHVGGRAPRTLSAVGLLSTNNGGGGRVCEMSALIISQTRPTNEEYADMMDCLLSMESQVRWADRLSCGIVVQNDYVFAEQFQCAMRASQATQDNTTPTADSSPV